MQDFSIKLSYSRYLIIILFFLYLGAIGCVSVLKILWWIRFIGIFFLIASFFLYARYFSKWKYLKWNPKQGWQVESAEQLYPVVLHGSSLRTVWLIILNFRYENKPWLISLILFPDTMQKDEFRRLNIFLLSQQWRKYEDQYRYKRKRA